MNMTKKAIELIQTTARQAAKAEIVAIPGDPDRALISQCGSREMLELPPKHRNHAVFDLDSLLSLSDTKCGYGEDGEPNVIVWHSEEEVVVVLDDDTRRDFAKLKLEYSKAFAALRRISAGVQLEQFQFARLLKVELDGCVPATLSQVVRSLKFARNEEGESDLQHGKSTLGRRVEANITGSGDIPEEFVVSTNVYANVLQDDTRQVRVSIDIDLEEHKFGLSVIGDELSMAVLLTQETLSERLMQGNNKRRVLFGKP